MGVSIPIPTLLSIIFKVVTSVVPVLKLCDVTPNNEPSVEFVLP